MNSNTKRLKKGNSKSNVKRKSKNSEVTKLTDSKNVKKHIKRKPKNSNVTTLADSKSIKKHVKRKPKSNVTTLVEKRTDNKKVTRKPKSSSVITLADNGKSNNKTIGKSKNSSLITLDDNRKSSNKVKRGPDLSSVNPYILYSVLALVAIGIIMVFSASYYDALYKHKDVFFFLKKELTWVPVGLVALVVMMLVDYHFLKKFTLIAYLITIVALVAVLLVGSNINGATRWLNIAGVSFQPSELAKYVIVFFLAMIIDKYGNVNNNWKTPLLYLGSAVIFSVLVYKENNLSIASIIMFVAFIMVFVSGMSFKETFALIGIGGVAGTIGIFSSDYRTERFISFLNPWKYANDEGYQLIHSLYALGSGGLFGAGLGNSKQKALYMPEPHNDFIFAIIGEELGLIGCIVVIAIFVILIAAGIQVAYRAKDKYGKLLATGIISVIAVQAIINIAVVSGSMPVTGVPLPFISYGGTSLVFNLAAMGVLLNISRQCKNPKDEIEEKIIKNKMNV